MASKKEFYRRDCDKSFSCQRDRRRQDDEANSSSRGATCTCLGAPTGAQPKKRRPRFFSADLFGGELRATTA